MCMQGVYTMADPGMDSCTIGRKTGMQEYLTTWLNVCFHIITIYASKSVLKKVPNFRKTELFDVKAACRWRDGDSKWSREELNWGFTAQNKSKWSPTFGKISQLSQTKMVKN